MTPHEHGALATLFKMVSFLHCSLVISSTPHKQGTCATCPFLLFHCLPPFAFPGTRDRLLDLGHVQGLGKARLSLPTGNDGVQEVVGFDHFQVVITQISPQAGLKWRWYG